MPSKKPLREIVLIFPFDKERKKLLIIEEYIHHYDRHFWKIVSGGVDKEGRSLMEHAQEELAEEVSLSSKHWLHFHSFEKIFGCRGIHCFIAEDPQLLETPIENPDMDIITSTRWVSEEEFHAMIDAKELIWNESTLVALQVFKKYREL